MHSPLYWLLKGKFYTDNRIIEGGKLRYLRQNRRMSIFENRDKSALLVIDVQNGVVEDAFARDSVITQINEQNDNLSGYRLPGRRAKVVESAAITF